MILKLAYPTGPRDTEGTEIALDLRGTHVRAFVSQPDRLPGVCIVSHLLTGRKLAQFHCGPDLAAAKAQAWLDAEADTVGKQRILEIMNDYEVIN